MTEAQYYQLLWEFYKAIQSHRRIANIKGNSLNAKAKLDFEKTLPETTDYKLKRTKSQKWTQVTQHNLESDDDSGVRNPDFAFD